MDNTLFFSFFNFVYIERTKKTEIPFKPVRSCSLKMLRRFLMPHQRKAKSLWVCSALKSPSPQALIILPHPCFVPFSSGSNLQPHGLHCFSDFDSWYLFFPLLLSHEHMACSPLKGGTSEVSVLIELGDKRDAEHRMNKRVCHNYKV